MIRRKRLIIEIMVFMVAILGIRAWQQRDVPGGQAPDLHRMLLGGKAYTRPREPVLVQFWGTWCPICRTEEASIEKLSKTHHVVTVALKSGSDIEVAGYMKSHGLDYGVLNDPAGEISSGWGVEAVPASFFLDSKGRIRFVEFGYTTPLGLRLRLWLAKF